jgi:uncharacterized protein with NAD-binding domain and iron-sulfur cluster
MKVSSSCILAAVVLMLVTCCSRNSNESVASAFQQPASTPRTFLSLGKNKQSFVKSPTRHWMSLAEKQDESPQDEEQKPSSAAKAWAASQQQQNPGTSAAADDDDDKVEPDKPKKRFVVVGAGWGGWGAAKALCESGKGEYEVTILDALPDPTGQTPYLSKTGKPVEAGTRGFWKDYPNINALCAELGMDENDIFTDYTNSSFYSPDGLEATAPVFANAKFPELKFDFLPFEIPFLSSLADQKIPQLPSPLGQVLATFPLFERIPLADRASMVGLLVASVDCLGGDESVQEQYDRMTAHELFLRFQLSPRLVEDFIKPTLLVGLFKPPEELSALVVMELLYYYALAHMDSFDVRWIKNGTVADSLIAPLAASLVDKYNLKVLGGCRVGKISVEKAGNAVETTQKVSSVEYTQQNGMKTTITDVDGVVLALTCRGMQGVVSSSPDLARFPVFSQAASCKGIDVISVRLWLDRVVPTRTPANVFSRFSELRGAGGTFFMLDQLQKNDGRLWGEDSSSSSSNENDAANPRGSVVACDFYNAGALLPLTDDDIVATLMNDLLPAAVAEFGNAHVVDSWVGRYPGAVSWFAPGTFTKRPPLQGAGSRALPNLKCAGDWVRMGEREHGAKGLCQERAYVSGLEAANALLEDTVGSGDSTNHKVLPVREDEAQFKASMALNKEVMKFLPRFWVR